MKERQFLWGLSFGIAFLGIAGVFWFGLGVSSFLKPASEWYLWLLLTVIQLSALVSFLLISFSIRKRSGFKTKNFKELTDEQRLSAKSIRKNFMWTSFIQALLIVVIVLWCNNINAINQMWSWISLVISFHFLPLGKIFNVTAYYVTGICGCAVSVISIIGAFGLYTILILGIIMALIMWLSAVYLFFMSKNIQIRS